MKPHYIKLGFIASVLFFIAQPALGQSDRPTLPDRSVLNNVLVSSSLPEIRVAVAPEFTYVGRFDFFIRDVAYGERFVFVDADDKKVQRLFIFQFEGFLPTNTMTYNYNFSQAEEMGGFRFRQNTWAYSNNDALINSPEGEGSLTAKFLRSKGYELEDELMMSRFLMVPDEERRNELILFYLENASTTGRSIASFYDNQDNRTAHWREISKELTARSRESFSIVTSKSQVSSRDIEAPFYFAVKVANMERSTEWYQQVLGLEMLDETWIRNDSLGIVNLMNERLAVELIFDARSSSKGLTQGFFKVGFHVPNVGEIADRIERKTSSRPGIVNDEKRGIRILQLKDPDNNTIQLQSPLSH